MYQCGGEENDLGYPELHNYFVESCKLLLSMLLSVIV